MDTGELKDVLEPGEWMLVNPLEGTVSANYLKTLFSNPKQWKSPKLLAHLRQNVSLGPVRQRSAV